MLEMLLMVGKAIAKLLGVTNVTNIADGGVKPVVTDTRFYPVAIGNPILLVNGYPYSRSRLTQESFAGSVFSPVMPTGQSNLELNAVPLTGSLTGNVANPVGVYYQITPLNPFTVSGLNIA